ncbi:MAG: hypothetical protein JW918_10195 [Anaerolineae bacterium]|nr:hypothetical protein [Anaerolineae bacterium]
MTLRRKLAFGVSIVGLVVRIGIVLVKPEVLWLDDSFYSLGIARNIALGKGWTHDGIHVTNGFQPLYVFIMVPFYAGLPGSDHLVPALSLVMEAILNVATGWLLFRLIDSRIGFRGALLSLMAWSLSPYIISGVNGLETPIQAFLLILIVTLYLESWRFALIDPDTSTQRRSWIAFGLGLLLGLLVLVRVDSLVFVAMLLADLILRFVLYLRHDRTRVRVLWGVALVGIVVFVAQLPWFAASWGHTGRLAFDSGAATRLYSRAHFAGDNIFITHLFGLIPYLQLRTVTSFLPWSAMMPFRYFVISVLALVGVYLLAYRTGKIQFEVLAFIKDSAFLWFYGVGLLGAYVFYQFTMWNWPRYFYPLGMLGLILLSVWVEAIYSSLQNVFLANRPLGSIVYALLCIGFVVTLPFSLPADINPLLAHPADWFTKTQYNAAAWLKGNTPVDARIGAFQSGILGYYSDRQVVNLDGVVNYAAIPYNVSGDTAIYLANEDVDYFVEWSIFFHRAKFSEAGLSATVVKTFEGTNDITVVALSSQR